MLRRHTRLLVPTLVVTVAALWWGCTQPDDILAEKSTTVVHLLAERLPTTPPGMTYQLWAADTMIAGDELGDSLYGSVEMDEPFIYKFEENTFHEVDGTARPDSNRFLFAGDILSYQWIFITVQLSDGSGPVPGPVMLMDTVTRTDYSQLNLVFPFSDSLWFTAMEFNMETPSDGRDPTTDGAAIWFSTYDERTWRSQDTTALLSWTIDTVYRDTFNTPGECITNIVNIFDTGSSIEEEVYGFDTVSWQAVTFSTEVVTVCDSGQGHLLQTSVDLRYATGTPDSGRYDHFTQVAIDLPDLRRMGWEYQGWVVSSVIKELGVGIGEITPPAWVGFNRHDTAIHATDGGLLSTGLFHSLYLPDDGNPYVDTAIRVPPYPGEDFLKNLPGGQDVEVNLVPGDGAIIGSAFIAMHPVNALTDTTNFPLIIQLRDLPGYRFGVVDDHQQFIMFNKTSNNTFGMGQPVGLPQVQVRFVRF